MHVFFASIAAWDAIRNCSQTATSDLVTSCMSTSPAEVIAAFTGLETYFQVVLEAKLKKNEVRTR